VTRPPEVDSTFAERYLRWWAPVLRRDAEATLDLVAADVAAGARRILDLGTGTGTLGLAAAERWSGVMVTGVDVSDEMVALAGREADRRLGEADRGRFAAKVAPADDLPFEAATFDLVVSSFVLQLVANRASALREARRILRPGGRIAFVSWLAGDVRFAGDQVVAETLEELGIEAPERDGGGAPDFTSPRAAADGLRRAGFRQAQAWAGMLEHGFDPDRFVGFLDEFDEEDLFAGLVERQRRRLVARLRERLAELPPAELVLRLPIVRATAVAPETSRTTVTSA